MRERPIIFNSEMVRAVMEGRKVQTRRAVKFPLRDKDLGCELSGNELAGEVSGGNYRNCPFGAVGYRLWVRETWSEDFANYYPNDRVWYAADDDRRLDIEVVDGVRGIFSPESNVHVPFRWRPSIHMPRWASRITLEITGVRVERLQDISAEDVTAEGIKTLGESIWGPRWWAEAPQAAINDAQLQFSIIWSKIYGEESWQANPWVWVIEFKRVEGE